MLFRRSNTFLHFLKSKILKIWSSFKKTQLKTHFSNLKMVKIHILQNWFVMFLKIAHLYNNYVSTNSFFETESFNVFKRFCFKKRIKVAKISIFEQNMLLKRWYAFLTYCTILKFGFKKKFQLLKIFVSSENCFSGWESIFTRLKDIANLNIYLQL